MGWSSGKTQEEIIMEYEKTINRMKSMQANMKAQKVKNPTLSGLLETGVKATDEKSANNFWSSIRALVKAMSLDNLIPSRSTLPEEVQANILTACADVEEASIAFFNHGMVSQVIFRHGKSGGGTFATAEDYVKVMSQMTAGKLRQHYNSKAWDGSLPINVSVAPAEATE
tara:strand:+ start:545 stop:1054 length:510 start_codon:yes stop_codon:yes gene_type:complete